MHWHLDGSLHLVGLQHRYRSLRLLAKLNGARHMRIIVRPKYCMLRRSALRYSRQRILTLSRFLKLSAAQLEQLMLVPILTTMDLAGKHCCVLYLLNGVSLVSRF